MHNSVMSQFVPDCDAPHFPLVLLVHTPSPSTRRFRRSTKKRDGGSSPASLFVDAAGGSRRMHLPGSIYLLLVGGSSFFCPKHLVWKKVRKGAVFGGWFSMSWHCVRGLVRAFTAAGLVLTRKAFPPFRRVGALPRSKRQLPTGCAHRHFLSIRLGIRLSTKVKPVFPHA